MGDRQGFSRRHVLELAAIGGLAMVTGARAAAEATLGKPHIERFDPALDAILSPDQPIMELATGFGGGGTNTCVCCFAMISASVPSACDWNCEAMFWIAMTALWISAESAALDKHTKIKNMRMSI